MLSTVDKPPDPFDEYDVVEQKDWCPTQADVSQVGVNIDDTSVNGE